MIFRQIVDEELGCASYFLADEGSAAVVDPCWDISVYLEAAAEAGAEIAYVLDTHNHADHVSGRERLASLAGACSLAPASDCRPEARICWEDVAREMVCDGRVINVGRLRLRAMATPGHRPEHLAFLVSDLSRSEDVWLVLSGDSLLVGDLARPDPSVQTREGAQALHRSVQRLVELGDHVELWPGHVQGSRSGARDVSAKRSSTIGYERRCNPLLASGVSELAAELKADSVARPPHVDHVVGLNARRRPQLPSPPYRLEMPQLLAELQAGAQVLDGRPADDFDAGHIEGAINLPPGRGQGTRAGLVLGPEDPLVVVAADSREAHAIAERLHSVGLWNIVGLLEAAPEVWAASGVQVRTSRSWDPFRLSQRLLAGRTRLIDVRDREEWQLGHVRESRSLPLHRLADVGPADLEPSPLDFVVACEGGGRAAFAASVLRLRTGADVVRVARGGIEDLPARGITLVPGD